MIIPYNDKQVEVVEVEVINGNEPWSVYQLADGTVLSLKTVLITVFRALTEKAPDGSTLYLTRSQNIVKAKESQKK